MKPAEFIQSGVFLGVALLTALLAWAWRPAPPPPPDVSQVGEKLFPEIESADQAGSLKIVRPGEGPETETLTLSRVNNVWVLAEYDNYPADNVEQLAEATTLLGKLEVLQVVAGGEKNHAEFGVVAPTTPGPLKNGEAGMQVTMLDAQGNPLGDLIIGKQANDTSANTGESPQHYVRKAEEESVYLVEVDPEILTTDLSDWIKADLLPVTRQDFAAAVVRDLYVLYGQAPSGQRVPVGVDLRFEAELDWNANEFQWNLQRMLERAGGAFVETEMSDIEELHTEKLNAMRDAVTDLKIADVEAKPPGLSADFNIRPEVLRNPQLQQSLMDHGFLPAEFGGVPQLVSDDGEIRIITKDFVEYLIRFGAVAQTDDAGEQQRYLLVTARVAEDRLPKPDLQPKPPRPEAADGEVGEARLKAWEQEVQRIEAANAAAQERYDEQLRQARLKVAEQNARFGPWYYMIANDSYRKIRLGRDDVIRESEAAIQQGFGIDAFRELERGIDVEPPAAENPMPPRRPPGLPPGFPR